MDKELMLTLFSKWLRMKELDGCCLVIVFEIFQGGTLCSSCLGSSSDNITHYCNRISWVFCVYLEAVSVLPQLRLMQNTKVLDTRGRLLTALGYGLWPSMVLLSEIVQTFILADFCYYYVKSVFGGQLVLRLPAGVV